MPADLAQALAQAGVRAAFDALSFTNRKEAALAVQGAKRPETRTKRIRQCVATLRARLTV